MLLPIFLITLASSSIIKGLETKTVIRYDRQGGPFSHEFKQVQVKSFPVTISSTPNKALLTEAFQIDLSCDPSVSRALCIKVRVALQNTGERIAKEFNITTPIVVSCEFGPFCEAGTESTCTDENVLGGAQTGSSFAIVKDGQPVMYPQGLIKNLKPDRVLDYAPYDIVAKFNSQKEFFFPGDVNPILENQVDFEFVSTHELLHGLGFGSGFLLYSSVFKKFGATDGYIAPIISNGADEKATESTLFSDFLPIDIYDYFIVGASGQEWKDLGKDIRGFKTSKSIMSFISTFEDSSDPFKAAQQAYKDATSSIIFKTTKGIDVELYSPRDFEQGSSISHVSEDQNVTPDFIMIPALAPGFTLDEMLQFMNATSFLGPKSKAIMETIGWPTDEFPAQSIKLYTGSAFVNFRIRVLVVSLLICWI